MPKNVSKGKKKEIEAIVKSNPFPVPIEPYHFGRPKVFASPQDLAIDILVYFQYCQDNDLIPGILGLCAHLNISRETLLNYGNEHASANSDYLDVCKHARLMIESAYEQGSMRKESCAGSIFALKNHAGMTDKTEIKHSGKVTLDMNLSIEEIKRIQDGVAFDVKNDLKLLPPKD